MPLPELIEIVPPNQPAQAEVMVPGSKSITNRALILAALAAGETTLQGALWSEDTQVMVACLQRLGFVVKVALDPHEPGNRTIVVQGHEGKIPNGGKRTGPLELFVANAGTAARFLAAMVCLGEGVFRLHGVPRMHERPQAALFQALRELGYRVDAPHDKLPATIHGGGPRPGNCSVSIAESSQFASALLLSGKAGGWRMNILDENHEESPYVEMTRGLIEAFPRAGGMFQIEPDASSGSYFWAAGWVLSGASRSDDSPIRVAAWPTSHWQIDARFPDELYSFFSGQPSKTTLSRRTDLGDSIMTAIAISPLAPHPTRFTDLGRLRVQECERVLALRTELARCGANVVETGDALQVSPSELHGAEIKTYQDHRMAMCFAILGLKVPGIRIKNPACVKKTFPAFFQKLADPPPSGLGVAILDGRTGNPLVGDDLFAK